MGAGCCTIVSKGDEDLGYGIGAALRHERTRQNVTLAHIAEETRISVRFLSAIEEERFDQLPGTVFTRNFVRQYALALDLDPEPLLAQLPGVDITETPLPAVPMRQSEPRWDPRWNSAIASFAWLILAAGAAIGAYLHFNHPSPTKAGNTLAVAARVTAPKSAVPVPSPVPLPTPVAQPVSTPGPADPAHPVQVRVTAREESWVQVTADGRIAFTATLQPNETRSVEAGDQVRVVTGNAGGIEISLNGKQLEPIGPSGQVRTVKLTAEGSQLVRKTPPPDPL